MLRISVRWLHGVLLSLCCALALAASGTAPVVSEAGQKLDQYLTRIEALGFSGVVLVAKDDKILLHKGYGLANREQRIAYAPDTVFDIGSITKQFTAAAILRLEMAGKLRVTDSISKYFAEVPADKRGITLHQLLTHSSGLTGNFGGDYEEMPRDELVSRALASTLESAPGTRHQYSNAGYSLLGAIVEKVSGQPYETFLQQQVLRPAGMTRTGYRVPKREPAELAQGYQMDNAWGTPLDKAWAPDGPWWNLRCNGGLLSTVGDLYQWHRALQTQKVLSAPAKAKYFAPHVAEDESGSSHYGYGWVISRTARNTRLVEHSGGNGVFAADLKRYVDENAVIIAGSARSDFQSTAVTPVLAALLFREDIAVPPAVAAMDAATVARYSGTYALSTGGSLQVAAGISGANGLPALTIVPDTRVTFERLSGPVAADVRAQYGDREAQLLAALRQTRQGNFAPLARIYGESPERLQRNLPARTARYEARLGEFQRYELLGTVLHAEQVTTWMREVHARGAQVVEYVWEGPEVAFVRRVEGLGGNFFVASSEPGLFAYDPNSNDVQRVGVEQAEDGSITALVFRGADGPLRARRL